MIETHPIPLLYHAHHSQDAADLPFWLDWAKQQGGPILELGCGTGRVLLHLAAAGNTLFGLDHDAEMLDYLRGRIPDAVSNRITLIRGDLRGYCLSSRFSLILMPCNTYSTLSLADRRIALNRVRLHLANKGIFILSIPNPNLFTQISDTGDSENESAFIHPETGNPVQVSSQWNRSGEKLLFHWHYDHLSPDGRVERKTLSSTHYLQDADDILREFESAGLKVDHTFGDFEGETFTSESPNFIIVASSWCETR